MTRDVLTGDFIDRRSFLRGAAGVGVGLSLGLFATPHVAERVNDEVADVTGHPTGNASWAQMIKDECAKEEDPVQCERDYEPTLDNKISAQINAPIWEELVFRGLPSMILDVTTKDFNEDPMDVVRGGTEQFRFSRKELIVGAVSSLVFGFAHNFTSKGVDTKTIPASQTTDGFLYWCLMRRFGIASSMASHAAFNYRALRSEK